MKVAASLAVLLSLITVAVAAYPQANQSPILLPDKDAFLLTVFLKHDQTMNNVERGVLLDNTRWSELFPPEGVEIVDHYVMMGIGQVIVMRVPPERLRQLNRVIEQAAWGAFQTEFYVTYDLAAARAAQGAAQ